MQRQTLSVVAIGAAMLLIGALGVARGALKLGYTVKNIEVRDSNNNPTRIPDLGKKVVTVFYTDPDVKEQNERFREMLKAENLPKELYRGLGVVNLKDTWMPNFAVRRAVRQKEKKFNSLILTDPGHTLKDQWGLEDCNEKDVVIVIGADRKVKYLKMGAMSAAEMKSTLKLVKDLLAAMPQKKK
jgi:predicted transcriptional regulator